LPRKMSKKSKRPHQIAQRNKSQANNPVTKVKREIDKNGEQKEHRQKKKSRRIRDQKRWLNKIKKSKRRLGIC